MMMMVPKMVSHSGCRAPHSRRKLIWKLHAGEQRRNKSGRNEDCPTMRKRNNVKLAKAEEKNAAPLIQLGYFGVYQQWSKRRNIILKCCNDTKGFIFGELVVWISVNTNDLLCVCVSVCRLKTLIVFFFSTNKWNSLTFNVWESFPFFPFWVEWATVTENGWKLQTMIWERAASIRGTRYVI